MKKKMSILEHAFAASAGAYYSIDLTRDLVPGVMYQVIEDQEYSLNERIGLPENARFSDVTAYWGKNHVKEEEREAYFAFLSIPNLLQSFAEGRTHVCHSYWTKTVLFEPMLAEQHIIMYEDEASGDVLAITYILDQTREFREDAYKKELEEKQSRLEAALHAAEKAKEYQEIETALTAVDDVLDNITAFDAVTNESELDQAMPKLLSALGRYSMSDRAYVFSWASKERQTLRMTHEWCAPGVEPTIDVMQGLRLQDMPNWAPRLGRGEAIVSLHWDAERERTPEEYAIFDGQGIHSLIVIPIFASKRLDGYIGFDNPNHSTSELSVRLLTSIGTYIGGLKENLYMMEQLADKQASLEQSLRELRREKGVLDALSIDYTSVYYCDLLEDRMLPLKEGEYTNSVAAEKVLTHGLQSYSYRIQYYFDHFVIHESAPDFLEKMSAGYLREYLLHNDRFAYRFRARPNQAGLRYFEVQVVRLPNVEGYKAVMGYRYVDDIVAEQERQKIQLEKALAEATLNSEIVDSISKIYWLIYRMDLVTGTYEEVSAGSEMHRLTGKSGNTEEVFKEVRETFVAPEHQEMMRAFLDTSTLQKRLRDTESVAMEYHAASGSWHLGRFIVKKRDEQGRVTNVLYVVRQIDRQKQMEIEYREKLLATAEEARRANLAKTDFLRRMSHDIRTPINGIQGMVAIAEHYQNDPVKQKECRDKVKEASGFLLDLVNSVLDMNKLESGTVVLEHQPFDLITALDEANGIVEMNGALRGLVVTTDHTRITHRRVVGSLLHFKQILQNIAGNAVKYNRDGGVVRLSSEEIACEDGIVTYRFTCTDTGRGMSAEFLQHAFEAFSQENADARTSYMGTGLGLSIAKQLAEMMGGHIEVESELDVGTTFQVTLPFVLDTAHEETDAEEEDTQAVDLTGVTALLTEDNALNIEIAQFMLEKAGARVVLAQNGREAVETFAAAAPGTFDVVLMDVMMPVMDGLSATRAIRALDHPDAQTVPIFAMTANAFADDVALSREAGMNEHLSKPLDEKKLCRTIARYVAAKPKTQGE